MHADWGNNQALPPAWDSPTAVAALIYLDGPGDGLEGGGTCAVPRRGAGDPSYARERLTEQPGYGGRPFINDSHEAEAWFRANEPDVAERRQELCACRLLHPASDLLPLITMALTVRGAGTSASSTLRPRGARPLCTAWTCGTMAVR